MFIEVTRKTQTDTEVNVEITTDIPCENCRLIFTFNAIHQYAAALLKRHLSEAIGNFIQNEREQNYLQGYLDGKGHKQKRLFFSRAFRSNQ